MPCLRGAPVSLALVRLVKVAAEGRIGRIPARIYWFLVGKKTWIGAFFAVLWLVLRFLPPNPVTTALTG